MRTNRCSPFSCLASNDARLNLRKELAHRLAAELARRIFALQSMNLTIVLGAINTDSDTLFTWTASFVALQRPRFGTLMALKWGSSLIASPLSMDFFIAAPSHGSSPRLF
jgi:hypothetical protein